MAQPVAQYDGNYITCYPGSNQTDDGKLNMEFNMARLVTRVTSKNFCTVKPSYEMKIIKNSLGKPQIQIGSGQCSINGMDLIMTQSLVIDAPETAGDYYLIFKLYRDGSNNVKGDDVYGVTRTFMGLYLTYTTTKPEPLDNPDVLYLGKLHYDGENITDLVDDGDKYGRIWAEDILCKLKDPKHPDITRLLLQDLIYKLPDWYVSKEGDVIFGALDFLPGRTGINEPGVSIKAEENSASIIIKSPNVSETDDSVLSLTSNLNRTEIKLGPNNIYTTSSDWDLHLGGAGSLYIEYGKKAWLWGKEEVKLLTKSSGFPSLLLKDNKLLMDWGIANSDLYYEISRTNNVVQEILGKAKWQYNDNNNKLSLLSTDVSYLDIAPNTDFTNNVRIKNKLYLGNNSTYGNEPTYLSNTQWKLTNPSNSSIYVRLDYNDIIINGNGTGASYLKAGTSTDSSYAKLLDNGKLELKNTNSSSATSILFMDGNSDYNSYIYKTIGKNELVINTSHVLASGGITANGDIRANRVYNAVYNDIVEFMEKEFYEENIIAGDIVYFTENGKVTKYHEGISSTAIAGVVSSEETYGYALGGDGLEDYQKVPVALKGRVYVNIADTDIHTGDFINVDENGNTYKSYEYNNIYTIGIATQPEKDGRVYTMIK